MLLCPTMQDEIMARLHAKQWFAKLREREPELDYDRDADIFKHMESAALIAICVRTFDAPHPQLHELEEVASYEEGTIKDLLEKIAQFKVMLDPREGDLSPEQFWKRVIEIARTGTLFPLADIDGPGQLDFITRMAVEACLSPTAKPWLPSSETSTPAPSASES